jgi:hypothetical protein
LEAGRAGFCQLKGTFLGDTRPRRPHLIKLEHLENAKRHYQNQNNCEQPDSKAG